MFEITIDRIANAVVAKIEARIERQPERPVVFHQFAFTTPDEGFARRIVAEAAKRGVSGPEFIGNVVASYFQVIDKQEADGAVHEG